MGIGDNCKRTSYELKYTHKVSLQTVDAKRFQELINDNKIIRID